MGMGTDLDYVGCLARESARFAEAIRITEPDALVPSCPDWTADDLLWHLGWVQWWWGTIVRGHMTGPQAAELRPARPAGRAALLEFYQRASRDLPEILAAVTPQTPAWTWAQDQTAGFIRRRQAGEALIHRIDAELTAGYRTPVDPLLGADGVDEALRIMYGGVPDWGRFTPDSGKTLRLRATDTGDTWLVTLGRFTGTDPGGTVIDEPDIHAAETDQGAEAAVLVAGSAADLNCWLWHRPPAALIEFSGNRQVLSGFESVIAPGIS
jgi:uncharacterized protein (TIGR03083 family)